MITKSSQKTRIANFFALSPHGKASVKSRKLKFVSFFVVLTFSITSLPHQSYSTPPNFDSSLLNQVLPGDLGKITIPAEIGKIEDVFKGESSKTVILVQDAHAIPDAQRNIQKLIEYFQKQYGLDWVAIEGAASALDPQLFRSFPDKVVLEKTFQEYFASGELAGASAAAIFNKHPVMVHGLEDWALYEEGLGFYLEAMKNQSKLLEKLSVLKEELQVKKKMAYSEPLLKIDLALESFRENHSDLIQTLKMLASVSRPQEGTTLAVLLEEDEKDTASRSASEMRVRSIAEKIEKSLKSQPPSEENRKRLREFSTKAQEFQVSQITAEGFALFLKEFMAEDQLPLAIFSELDHLLKSEKRLRDIEGMKLFRDFEQYADSVKELLFRDGNERQLNDASRVLGILERLARLELSRDDWKSLKFVIQDKKLPFPEELLKAQISFYENAERRDETFCKQLLPLMAKHKKDYAMLVAGGFHTEGLTRRLKEKNISYLLLTPRISAIPESTHYRAQMRGDVPWKDYFQVEDGKIDLYSAFVRGTRDKLLGQEEQNPAILKKWRDQVIRDLAQEGKIERVGDYTPFIDEVMNDQQSRLRDMGLAKVEQFIEGLKALESTGRLTEQNLRQLFNPSSMSAPYSVGLAHSDLSAHLQTGPSRSELRVAVNEVIARFKKYLEQIRFSESSTTDYVIMLIAAVSLVDENVLKKAFLSFAKSNEDSAKTIIENMIRRFEDDIEMYEKTSLRYYRENAFMLVGRIPESLIATFGFTERYKACENRLAPDIKRYNLIREMMGKKEEGVGEDLAERSSKSPIKPAAVQEGGMSRFKSFLRKMLWQIGKKALGIRWLPRSLSSWCQKACLFFASPEAASINRTPLERQLRTIFIIGSRKRIAAHGFETTLRDLLSVMLEAGQKGTSAYRVLQNPDSELPPNVGILTGGNPYLFAGNHGPLYVVFDAFDTDQYVGDRYLVPEEKDKIFIQNVLSNAAALKIITNEYANEMIPRIHSYDDFVQLHHEKINPENLTLETMLDEVFVERGLDLKISAPRFRALDTQALNQIRLVFEHLAEALAQTKNLHRTKQVPILKLEINFDSDKQKLEISLHINRFYLIDLITLLTDPYLPKFQSFVRRINDQERENHQLPSDQSGPVFDVLGREESVREFNLFWQKLLGFGGELKMAIVHKTNYSSDTSSSEGLEFKITLPVNQHRSELRNQGNVRKTFSAYSAQKIEKNLKTAVLSEIQNQGFTFVNPDGSQVVDVAEVIPIGDGNDGIVFRAVTHPGGEERAIKLGWPIFGDFGKKFPKFFLENKHNLRLVKPELIGNKIPGIVQHFGLGNVQVTLPNDDGTPLLDSAGAPIRVDFGYEVMEFLDPKVFKPVNELKELYADNPDKALEVLKKIHTAVSEFDLRFKSLGVGLHDIHDLNVLVNPSGEIKIIDLDVGEASAGPRDLQFNHHIAYPILDIVLDSKSIGEHVRWLISSTAVELNSASMLGDVNSISIWTEIGKVLDEAIDILATIRRTEAQQAQLVQRDSPSFNGSNELAVDARSELRFVAQEVVGALLNSSVPTPDILRAISKSGTRMISYIEAAWQEFQNEKDIEMGRLEMHFKGLIENIDAPVLIRQMISGEELQEMFKVGEVGTLLATIRNEVSLNKNVIGQIVFPNNSFLRVLSELKQNSLDRTFMAVNKDSRTITFRHLELEGYIDILRNPPAVTIGFQGDLLTRAYAEGAQEKVVYPGGETKVAAGFFLTGLGIAAARLSGEPLDTYVVKTKAGQYQVRNPAVLEGIARIRASLAAEYQTLLVTARAA